MNKLKKYVIPFLLSFFLLVGASPSGAGHIVQCPGDLNGDAIPDPFLFKNNGTPSNQPNPEFRANVRCKHIASGDGFINMADKLLYPPDGYLQYIFGFSDMTGVPQDMVMHEAMLKAELPAPTLTLKEGDEFYLTLINVGMNMRPDLFDPHTIHWHGFPNASAIFDGEPMSSIAINMGAGVTYYYNVSEPGTFMYHCHVEATEHMQMGMLGNLYVKPKQDDNVTLKSLGAVAPLFQPYTGFGYNDGDGSTGYHVDYPIQIHGFDPNFHDASMNVQPLEFWAIKDHYAMLNGRGYPDTINPSQLANSETGNLSQKVPSLITATQGQKILLRISNLSFDFYTLTVLGIPMKVVAKDAKLLRGPIGNLYYDTNSIDLGGGETADAILDTTNVTPGTYFLYTTNLNYLSNDEQERGGMMTEIHIN